MWRIWKERAVTLCGQYLESGEQHSKAASLTAARGGEKRKGGKGGEVGANCVWMV